MDDAGAVGPIALFAYNRPELTRRTLEALAANRLARQAELVIFSDGAKNVADQAQVDKVRDLAGGFRGVKSVRVIAAAANQGLGHAIVNGVTRLIAEHGRAIVLEDDIVTAPSFLDFMQNALKRYAQEPSVAAISGYLPPLQTALPETFFLRDAECWGWATWRRAWSLFDADGARLLAEITRQGLCRAFDHDGTYPFTRLLKDRIAGRNSSWAILWRATIFLRGMLTLYPGRSLAQNIGFDGSGVNCEPTGIWDVRLSPTPVTVADIALEPCAAALEAYKQFNRENIVYGLKGRAIRKMRRWLSAGERDRGTAA